MWGCVGWVEGRAAWCLWVGGAGAGALLEAGVALATPEEDTRIPSLARLRPKPPQAGSEGQGVLHVGIIISMWIFAPQRTGVCKANSLAGPTYTNLIFRLDSGTLALWC